MTVITNSVSINRSPEEVFDALSDPRAELSWNPKVQKMELITDGPLGVGTKFGAKWKLSRDLILEITRFDRPQGWSQRNGGPVTVNLDITLSPDGSSTLLQSRFEARPNGAFRLVFPLFLIAIKREEKTNMALIKKWVESTPATHPA